MSVKKYFDVFAWADTHPQAKQFYEESLARIHLGEVVYKERTAQSLSVQELAQRSHLSAKTIRAIENSENSVKMETLFKLYRALGKKKLELPIY
jgi:plasmid maintenance system antidote protein VapI